MQTSHTVAFMLGGYPVYWYGIILAAGIGAAIALVFLREKKLGLPRDCALDVTLVAIPAALVAARLYFVAFSWPYFAADPWRILSVHDGGMAIYGGIIGGALAVLIYARAKRVAFLRLADLIAPALALGQGIGRWGNFVNQEAYGVAVTNPAWQFFPMAVWIDAQGAWFAATFFYESAWCVALCAGLLIAEKRRAFKRDGDCFYWYVCLYGLERAVVEGLRTDSLYLASIRVSQWLSILMLAFCAANFSWRLYRAGSLGRGKLCALCALCALLLCVALLCAAAERLSGVFFTAAAAAVLCAFTYRALPYTRSLAGEPGKYTDKD